MKISRFSRLLCVLFCISPLISWAAEVSYYDRAATSISQYKMSPVLAEGEWANNAFEDGIEYNTQEITFRSPRFKDFSINFTTLLNASNDREKINAMLDWGGIQISHETGSAEAVLTSNSESGDDIVFAGDNLPSFCDSNFRGDCIDKIMIEPGKEISMSFEGSKIQYTWLIKQGGIRSVIGYQSYSIETPLLIKKGAEVPYRSMVIRNGKAVHPYYDQYVWTSMIDSKGKAKTSGMYYGIDARELRIAEAYDNNMNFHHGLNGSFFVVFSSTSLVSSGEQEQLINDLYGEDFDKAPDYDTDLSMAFEFSLGYSAAIRLSRADKNYLFTEAGVRGFFYANENFSDDAGAIYEIADYTGNFYRGYYFSVGATF